MCTQQSEDFQHQEHIYSVEEHKGPQNRHRHPFYKKKSR